MKTRQCSEKTRQCSVKTRQCIILPTKITSWSRFCEYFRRIPEISGRIKSYKSSFLQACSVTKFLLHCRSFSRIDFFCGISWSILNHGLLIFFATAFPLLRRCFSQAHQFSSHELETTVDLNMGKPNGKTIEGIISKLIKRAEIVS